MIRVSTFPEALPSTAMTGRRKRNATRRGIPLRRWTPEEDQYLRKHYGMLGSVACARALGRPKSGVNARAEKLGIRSKRNRLWTPREEAILRMQYRNVTATRLAAMLKRSEQSVRHKLRLMGLTEAVNVPWSADEIAYLRAHYGKTTNAELAEEFGRSVDAVELKASRLGLSRAWAEVTPAMEKMVVKNLGKKDMSQIAREMGLNVKRVQSIALKHGYRARPTSRRWSAEDDLLLRELYAVKTDAELAERLVRTELAIKVRAQVLGLNRPQRQPTKRAAYRPWAPEEEKLLKRLYGRMPQKKIAERLGRTIGAIFTRVSLLGLVKRAR